MSEVKLPRSVQKQIKAAEQIQAQVDAAANAAPPLVPVEALTAPPVAPPAPAVQPPAPAPAPVEPTPTPPQVDLATQLAAADQRYRTLQGMMNTEMGTLRTQTRDALAAVESLKELLKAKEVQPQSQAMNPQDVEAFGAELVEMVRRQAKTEIEDAVRAHVGGVLTRLEVVEQKLQITSDNVSVTAEQQFYTALAAQVPDWKAMNADQGFLKWLGEVDPVYGVPRQAALDNAVGSGSVERTANIFRAYKLAATPPPAPVDDLSSQVTPPRSGGSAPPPAPVEAQYVSEKDIARFYNDMRLGRYRGKEAQAAQIEANINAAIAEGRVR